MVRVGHLVAITMLVNLSDVAEIDLQRHVLLCYRCIAI
jgi:hypothetical protein